VTTGSFADVEITGLRGHFCLRALYESFRFAYEEAVGAVESGDATLLHKAQGIEFDVDH
jgi:hypothetical protein